MIGSINVKCNVVLPNRIDYYTFHRVTDEVRGYLVYNGAWSFIPPSAVQQCFEIKKLALILESPHKDEYHQNCFIPIGPARGVTGIKIERFIVNRKWTNNLSMKYAYEVYIMNAVQYQCSAWNYISGFGKLNTQLRDSIFKELWKKLSGDFINRIQRYSPDYIINCCTGMESKNGMILPQKNGLASMVASAIKISANCKYNFDYHPSTLGKNMWK